MRSTPKIEVVKKYLVLRVSYKEACINVYRLTKKGKETSRQFIRELVRSLTSYACDKAGYEMSDVFYKVDPKGLWMSIDQHLEFRAYTDMNITSYTTMKETAINAASPDEREQYLLDYLFKGNGQFDGGEQ